MIEQFVLNKKYILGRYKDKYNVRYLQIYIYKTKVSPSFFFVCVYWKNPIQIFSSVLDFRKYGILTPWGGET